MADFSDTEEDLEREPVHMLRYYLRSRGLKTTGNKKDLVARLAEHNRIVTSIYLEELRKQKQAKTTTTTTITTTESTCHHVIKSEPSTSSSSSASAAATITNKGKQKKKRKAEEEEDFEEDELTSSRKKKKSSSSSSKTKKKGKAVAAPAKRPKKEEEEDEEKVAKKKPKTKKKKKQEKRLARYRSTPSQAVMDRISRAMHERLYLICRKDLSTTTTTSSHAAEDEDEDTEEEEEDVTVIKHEFVVLGSTGNVYTVTISNLPSCTCPDHAKGNLCKHILFVFLKVLKVPFQSPHIYQRALLTSELREIFSLASNNNNNNNAQEPIEVMANQQVQRAYRELVMGEAVAEKEAQKANKDDKRRKSIEDADCAICCETLTEGELVYCTTCGNNIHKDCFRKWQSAKRDMRDEVTCVYCRAPWPSTASGDAGMMNEEGYVNLAEVAGVSKRRVYQASQWASRGSLRRR